MFLALIASLQLGPFLVPVFQCQYIKSGANLTHFGNKSFAYQDLRDIIFSPFATPVPKLYVLQAESPFSARRDLEIYRNGTLHSQPPGSRSSELSKRAAPARVPRVRSKDYGKSSHYRIKGNKERDKTKKNYYIGILNKLLRPRSSHPTSTRRGIKDYFSSSKYSSPSYISSAPMEASPGGWGWGWSKGHHHDHHKGVSLLDLLLCGLSLLSLGGFLLNLLLNLLNMFGFGMFTTTSTYPVTVTSTSTGTGGATATSTGTAATLPTALSAYSSGLGFTGRTIDSLVGNGWGEGNQAKLKGHISLSKPGWLSTTAPVTLLPPLPTLPPLFPSLPPLFPSIIGRELAGGLENEESTFASSRKKRRKRETFQPYVDPSTALNIFAKSILNSMVAAVNQYECIEQIFCENNKQARVIGQWLDYFMPVYSFSLSYYGQRAGAHESLLDHIRAIVLGVTETNCHAHFPRCGEPIHP